MCKIIYKNKEYELKEYFEDIDNNYNQKDEISIKLKINKDIFNMSKMFFECNSLLEIKEITKKNCCNNKTLDLDNFEYSSSFEDDSQQNIINESEENSLYRDCECCQISKSISSIQNIYTFDNIYTINRDNLLTILQFDNVINMSLMFYGCSSLISLPDLSEWNTSNVNDRSSMFYECFNNLN